MITQATQVTPKKHLQNFTCWKCKYSWSDEPQVEDTVGCPKCGVTHGSITTDGSVIPSRGRRRV